MQKREMTEMRLMCFGKAMALPSIKNLHVDTIERLICVSTLGPAEGPSPWMARPTPMAGTGAAPGNSRTPRSRRKCGTGRKKHKCSALVNKG